MVMPLTGVPNAANSARSAASARPGVITAGRSPDRMGKMSGRTNVHAPRE